MKNLSTPPRKTVVTGPNVPRLEQAFRLATSLFARAKTDSHSNGPALTRPMSSVLMTEDSQVIWLQGLLFHDHPAPQKNQHALAVKLVALCTDAWAVLDVGEAWTADRCAKCGAMHPHVKLCSRCGAPPTPPRDNPFHREVIFTVLHLRESPLKYVWSAEARPTGNDYVVNWADVSAGEPCPANPVGRFEVPWTVDKWMIPHIVLNVPSLERLLGHTASPKLAAEARRIELEAPAGFAFMRIDPTRLRTALRCVAPGTLLTSTQYR
jgi:hypothetical protein